MGRNRASVVQETFARMVGKSLEEGKTLLAIMSEKRLLEDLRESGVSPEELVEYGIKADFSHLGKGLRDYWRTRMREKEHPFTDCVQWAKDHPDVIQGDPKAFCGWMHFRVFGKTPLQRTKEKEATDEGYRTVRKRKVVKASRLVYTVKPEAVESFLKKYPAVKNIMTTFIRKHDYISDGYGAFLKYKAAHEAEIGAGSHTIDSPTFGKGTFYNYEWGTCSGWAEVYQYLFQKERGESQ